VHARATQNNFKHVLKDDGKSLKGRTLHMTGRHSLIQTCVRWINIMISQLWTFLWYKLQMFL